MRMLSNTPPARNSSDLWNHFSQTYLSLRVGLFVLAFTMPFVLFLYGRFGHGIDLQPSMSAYFWAASEDQCASFPMRTIFVGYLFAIGVGLFVYKGLTNLENILLNIAAICAFAVAIFPESLTVSQTAADPRMAELFENCPAVEAWAAQPSFPIHYAAAVLLFVLLAVVSWFCAEKSLEYLPPDHDSAKYRRVYKSIAVAMIVFPIVGYAVAFVLGMSYHKIFFIEAAGVMTFGTYWAVKTGELKLSGLEKDPEVALRYARDRQIMESQSEKLDM